jgi:nucleoside recognition membrane protein YjiH
VADFLYERPPLTVVKTPVALGNFNCSGIIKFAESLRSVAKLMLSVLSPFLSILSFFSSRAALQAEILVLRRQIGVLRRSTKKRPS